MNGLFYTAISRVKSGAGLFLENFQSEYIKANPDVENKIKAMSTLSPYQFKKVLLHERIFVNDEEIKLGYINTMSLLNGKSLEFINNDRNLHGLDYLVVADTGLDDSTSTEYLADHLSNWRVQHRFDVEDGKRHMGLLLLQGQSATAEISFEISAEHKWRRGDRVTQILNVFFKEFHLDASFVYINKTPTKSDLDKLSETLDSSHLVMGDLNLDMDRAEDQGKLNSLCGESKRRVLSEITTNQLNQLDHVILVKDPAWQDAFSTSYWNYTSDHKVIVIRVPKKGNHFSSQFKQRLHFDQDKETRTGQKRKAEPCSQSPRRIQPAMTTRKRKSGETEDDARPRKESRSSPDRALEYPDITATMNEAIQAILSLPSMHIVNINNIILEKVDIESLKEGEWLNDQIINGALQLITMNSPSTFAFSTDFIARLKAIGYNFVKTHSRPIDPEGKGNLFSQKLVLVPIFHNGNHWTLVAIKPEEKSITYYDSKKGRNHEVLNILLDYLKQEHRAKKKCELEGNWTLSHAQNIPCQENFHDCGMFVIKYAQYLARGEAFTFNQTNMSYYRRRLIWELVNKTLLFP